MYILCSHLQTVVCLCDQRWVSLHKYMAVLWFCGLDTKEKQDPVLLSRITNVPHLSSFVHTKQNYQLFDILNIWFYLSDDTVACCSLCCSGVRSVVFLCSADEMIQRWSRILSPYLMGALYANYGPGINDQYVRTEGRSIHLVLHNFEIENGLKSQRRQQYPDFSA